MEQITNKPLRIRRSEQEILKLLTEFEITAVKLIWRRSHDLCLFATCLPPTLMRLSRLTPLPYLAISIPGFSFIIDGCTKDSNAIFAEII